MHPGKPKKQLLKLVVVEIYKIIFYKKYMCDCVCIFMCIYISPQTQCCTVMVKWTVM